MFGHHFMLPVVTPIALEVAQDLVETVQLTGDSPSGLKQLVEEMRTSIGVTLGIRPPGIRIRGNEVDMPPASYLIMLDEIPRVMGTVDPRKVLCLADISALSDASLEGVQNLQAAEKASPPPDKSGRAATWCPVEWSEALGKAGFETWDAAKYIQEHLGSVLIANLEMFVTMDAIEQDLLKIDASGALFERLRGARGGVARFVEVARSLLMEELAIAPTNTLISHYLACVEEPTVEVAERMRQTPAIHAQLTRDVADWCLYVLADSYEARLREGVHQGKDGAVLSLEPEATQELLAAVRTAVGSLTQDKRQVLVVQDWYLRPFVRSLLVLEFPDLRVVARREIESLAGVPPPTAAISWEP